jgi:V/A-type H+/Na+-transporting ATPase subunit C
MRYRRLEESPYTYVRVMVMRTLLISAAEYPKLMKMSLPEISNFLAQTQYTKEINELGVSHSGIELIEKAMTKNFVGTVEKLKRISPDSFNAFIDAYVMKYDIANLKTLVRSRVAKLGKDATAALLHPLGKDVSQLIEVEDLDVVMKSLPEFYDTYTAINDTSVMTIENALDKHYFSYLLGFAQKIPRQGGLFKAFLLESIHNQNMLTLLRLKREGVKGDSIKKYLFFTDDKAEGRLYEELLTAKQEDVRTLLAKSSYKHVADAVSGASLIPCEVRLQAALMHTTLQFQHQQPLSVFSILSYLYAKEIEIQNLQAIVKGKHLQVSMDKVAELVVI